MTYAIATVLCGGPGLKLPERDYPPIFRVSNTTNVISPCQAYWRIHQRVLADVIIYIHDDVTIHDADWIDRIMEVFEEHPPAVAVGLGGATKLGSDDLLRKPYDIRNMARSGYASNQTDAEVHGEQFTGVRRVAVLDAFCMAVNRRWLECRGGWPTSKLTHHCLDLWLACEAARDNKDIYMVGASCTHHGGGSSTKEGYAKARWLQGGTLESDHQRPHEWLYREYKDVLPIEV